MPALERLWPLVALPLVALLIRGGRGPVPWLRCAAVLLLILAACGPSLPLARRPCHLALVVDRSASTGARAEVPREVPSGWSSVSVIEFGRDAAVCVPPAPPPLAPWPAAQVDPSATSVEEALRLALANSPADSLPTVWLMSDGRQNRGDARRAMARIRARGGRLFTCPPPVGVEDVRIAELLAPSQVAEGEPVGVEAVVRATRRADVRVSLSADGREAGAREGVEVSPEREARVRFSLPPLAVPVLALEARVSSAGPDAIPENDVAWAVVRRAGRPRVLLVAEPGRRLEQALRAADEFDLRVSTSLAGAEAYDAVVLDDRPAQGLPDLSRYVRDGRGGLVVAGGPRSFGPGGYAGTPLAGLLPVWCLPKEPFSLVVLLDASGSMGEGTLGATKYETALLALEAVRELLRPGDRVELIRFAGESASDGFVEASRFSDVLARARAQTPSGPTAMIPALERGVADLEREASPRRHLLVISDGELADNEVGSRSFAAFARRLERVGAGRTVLATGERPNEKEMRALAGGGYLPMARLEELPAALRRDLIKARKLTEEQPSAPSRTGESRLVPGVSGYPAMGRDRVTARDGATVEWSFADGTPLYACWQAGVGRVVAVPTTLEAPWGEGWSRAPEAMRLWTAAVRWALPPSRVEGASWGVEGDRLVVRIGGPFVRPSATITSRNGKPLQVDLTAVGPERYEARLPEAGGGVCRITLSDGARSLGEGAIALPPGREWQEVGTDRSTLAEWARLGGGALSERGLPQPPSDSQGGPFPVGPWLAGVSLGFLFLDGQRRAA